MKDSAEEEVELGADAQSAKYRHKNDFVSSDEGVLLPHKNSSSPRKVNRRATSATDKTVYRSNRRAGVRVSGKKRPKSAPKKTARAIDAYETPYEDENVDDYSEEEIKLPDDAFDEEEEVRPTIPGKSGLSPNQSKPKDDKDESKVTWHE